MTRKSVSSFVILAVAMTSTTAFTPSIRPQHVLSHKDVVSPMRSSLHAGDSPVFVNIVEESSLGTNNSPVISEQLQTKSIVTKKKKPTSAHSDGIFTPVVRAAKVLLGEDKLNKVRAKAISTHSDVISSFVETSDTKFGSTVLKQLFFLADKDRNGTICEKELQAALTSLGFDWLQEKQIQGIFARADADGNGTISLDEWIAEAPKTLRTNLIKLAKKNGGNLGFLS